VQAGDKELEESDVDLVRSAGRGDDQAFHTLIDRHADALYRVARSLSRNRADAEDLVQETLLCAYRGARTFAGRSSAKTWMLRILTRLASRSWRRLKKRGGPMASIDSAAAESDAALARDPGTGAVDHRIDVMEILNQLSEPHREVLLLREIGDLSYDEIARELGVPRGTVESRLARAREQFRQRFLQSDPPDPRGSHGR
jgi:RNA polymerase sigma-70 factor (ECF subfamily)